MKKIILLLLISTLFKVSPAYGQDEKNCLGPSEKAFILSRFCTEVKYNFVHYNNLKFDWDSLCVASSPLLAATRSDEDFVDGMKRLCARLQDGHTFIHESNNPKNTVDLIRPLPMQTKRVDDRVFVTGVRSLDFERQGVSYGCEVLKINGENVIDYAKNHLRPLLASSTSQWSDFAPFRRFELTKERGFKTSRILFRNPKGKTFTIESSRNIKWDKPDSSVTPTLEFKVLDNNIGLLVVRSFQNGGFQTEEFDKLYNEILKTNALIIDIRNNEGGSSSFADYLIRHFSDKPVEKGRWSSRMYIAAHGSWGYSQEWYMQSPKSMDPIKDKTIYKKPVALLVNALTFSSAENLCVTFRGLNRGKIIGTPTGGSTGNPIVVDLGFGMSCSICTRNEWGVNGEVFIGKGIIPDIEVKENADYYLKNKDIVIEKAIEVLDL